MTRPTGLGEPLTERELDVLRLVAQGLSNAEVGRALFLGENTIKTHLWRAGAKLGTEGRVASVVAAIAAGKLQASYGLTTGLQVTRTPEVPTQPEGQGDGDVAAAELQVAR